MCKVVIILIAGLALSQLTDAQEIAKLPISVYYESLCPDSVQFIVNQLYPTWQSLGAYIDVTFIPFGKSASVNNGEQFVCQHGPKECIGNKLQSCTLNLLAENVQQVEYVYCVMRGGTTAKECSNLVGAPWENVKSCFNSDLGTQLQLQAEAYTAAIKPKFIPTVIINQKFNQQNQDEAQVNFKGLICRYLDQVYPEACR